jgi:hypothetical protein
MAVMNLETLVLRGVNVVRDVVIGLERNGSNLTGVQAPVSLSSTRHPSASDPWTDTDPGKRYERAMQGAAHAAIRAGRPGSLAGVLGSRSPARCAGRAILSGWSQATGGFCPSAAWCLEPLTAEARTAAGDILSGRAVAFPRGTLQPVQPRQLTRLPRSAKRAGAELAVRPPAHGTHAASTRGKQDVG